MKRILITGSNSFIGTSFEKFMAQFPTLYEIDTVDMVGDMWKNSSFSGYDVVFHVAGIAHSDHGKISDEKKKLYYQVNTDLCIATALKAKQDGVKQFIFMSSAIVYGESAPIGKEKIITRDTPVSPANVYADSKMQAEIGLSKLEDETFKVAILRPPMIYGEGCKGNYVLLSKFAKKFLFFPYVNNTRSMLYIDNLTAFVRLLIDNEERGVFWPQNPDHSNTSEMVSAIAKAHGRSIKLLKGTQWILRLLGKKIGLINKAFGSLVYDPQMSVYDKGNYQIYDLERSIEKTENSISQKHLLIVSQYFYPEEFRINDMCTSWVERGYKVTVLTGIPNYPQGKFYKGYNWFQKRKEIRNGIQIIRIPLFARGKTSLGLVLNYLSFVASGFFWKTFTRLKADRVFIFEVSPMTQALVGVWYAQKRNIPCDLYVQDLWPENVEIITGIHNPLIINPIKKMVRYIYRNCTTIYGTSPSFVECIKQQCNAIDTEVRYLPQYAEKFYIPNVEKSLLCPTNDCFKIVFTGNIGKAQGLDILPKTAQHLKETEINVLFVIVGDGRYKGKLIEEIQQRHVENMFLFIDRRPAEEIPSILSSCDAAFISFMNNALFSNTIPAKLQSYMACGMPIVASANGETKRIIEEAQCGYCCDIGDSRQLADIILKIMESPRLEDMSKRAVQYCTEHFNKDKLLDMLDENWSFLDTNT